MAGKRIRKLASGVSLLEKEILKPGVYVDEDGVEFEITEEEIRGYVEGTQKLLDIEFRVNGFPDHQSNSSTSKLGRWRKTWIDDQGCALGYFEPKNAEAEEIALDNDCSAVLVDGLNLGQVKIPRAMPRIDIVPQGAVLGLKPFRRVAALAAGMNAERVRRCARKEKRCTVKSRLAKLLAKCLGMDETENEADVMSHLSSHCLTSKGLQTEGLELGDDDLAGALMEILMSSGGGGDEQDPEAPGEGVMADEGEALEELADSLEDEQDVEEELEMSAAPAKKLATGAAATGAPTESAVERDLRSQLASLQRRELDTVIGRVRRLSSKTSIIEANSIEAVRADYAEDVKAFGHDKALHRAKRSLSLYLQISQEKSKGGKKAERKLSTPPGKKDKAADEPCTGEHNILLATRGGPHRNGTSAR